MVAFTSVRPVIALIDDSRFTLLAWKSRLQSRAVVHAYESPESFWAAAAADPALVPSLDLLVIDYVFENSPHTGPELAARLRTELPGVPLVLSSNLTALGPEADRLFDAVLDKDAVTWTALDPLLAPRRTGRA